ncbi:unnamed protein product [Polarella glacialis]|uniref:Uncharacterized protein n=2 Tax=Polarella glacialis TaxID=89957 RepID=A0A813DPZ7_POLGL|nr:unnamed protein product [Polarella glacialis]
MAMTDEQEASDLNKRVKISKPDWLDDALEKAAKKAIDGVLGGLSALVGEKLDEKIDPIKQEMEIGFRKQSSVVQGLKAELKKDIGGLHDESKRCKDAIDKQNNDTNTLRTALDKAMMEQQQLAVKMNSMSDVVSGTGSRSGAPLTDSKWLNSAGRPMAATTTTTTRDARQSNLQQPTVFVEKHSSGSASDVDDRSMLVFGGWDKHTLKEVMYDDVRQVLAGMPNAPAIEALWSARNRHHVCFCRFKSSFDHTAIDHMWTVLKWYVKQVKHKCTGSNNNDLWMQPHRTKEYRNFASGVNRGLKFLHQVKESKAHPATFLQHGKPCKVVEGCFKSGAAYVYGNVIGTFKPQLDDFEWDITAATQLFKCTVDEWQQIAAKFKASKPDA